MKPVFGCIAMLAAIITASEQCLDPFTASPTATHAKAKLFLKENTPALQDLPQVSYIFQDVPIYTLSDFPLVQYALLEENGVALALRLKEPYKKNSNQLSFRTDHGGTLQFNDFEVTAFNDTTVFLETFGASRGRILLEMNERCEFFVVQMKMEKVLFYMLLMGAVLLVYILYSLFNFIINFGTLRELWRGSSILGSAFDSLSQSMTSRRISKHHQLTTERMYINTYTKMNELDKKIASLEESDRLSNMLSKNRKTLEYDYIDSSDSKNFLNNWNNDTKNNRKSEYLTPKNSNLL